VAHCGHKGASWGWAIVSEPDRQRAPLCGEEEQSLHCMIAWGAGNGGVPLSSTDHETMEAALAGKDWVRTFPGAVVVTLADDAERQVLQDKLVEASKAINGRAFILISPLMATGTGIYRGFLQQPVWEPLNKKTV